MLFNHNNVFKYINNAITDLYEYSKEEIMSWTPEEYIQKVHPEDREKLIERAIKRQTGDVNFSSQNIL